MFMGKLLGALFGYWVFGIYGAVAGFLLGFLYDRNLLPRLQHRRHSEDPLTPDEIERARQSFFATPFAVLGQVATADAQLKIIVLAVP